MKALYRLCLGISLCLSGFTGNVFAQTTNFDRPPADFKSAISEYVSLRSAIKSWEYQYTWREFNPVKPSERGPVRSSTGDIVLSAEELKRQDQDWEDQDKRMTVIRGMVLGSNETGEHLHIAILCSPGERYANSQLPEFAAYRLLKKGGFQLLVADELRQENGRLCPVEVYATTPNGDFMSTYRSSSISRARAGIVSPQQLGPCDFRAAGLYFPAEFENRKTLEQIADTYLKWPAGLNKTVETSEGKWKYDCGNFLVAFDPAKGMYVKESEIVESEVRNGQIVNKPLFRSELNVDSIDGFFVPTRYSMTSPNLVRSIDYHWEGVNSLPNDGNVAFIDVIMSSGKPLQ